MLFNTLLFSCTFYDQHNVSVCEYVVRGSHFCNVLAFSSFPFARLRVLGVKIISVLPLIRRLIDVHFKKFGKYRKA